MANDMIVHFASRGAIWLPCIVLREDVVLRFGIFVVVHQDLLDLFAGRFVKAAGSEFATNGLNGYIRTN